MNQSELEANTCNRRQARRNACEQVTIGLSFTSDWSRKWHENFQPITEQSKAKPKQNANYFRHSIENRSIEQVIQIYVAFLSYYLWLIKGE